MAHANDTIKFLDGLVLKAEAESRCLRRNVTLLCAAIEDETLSREQVKIIARMLTQPPLKPTREIIEWARHVAERAQNTAQEARGDK